ncbi:uncharacterized protein K452DRAFT_309895 [Aplosporella prunicola CBS 121167]|uniref:Uncharacterized protein n=1 Tax=Aplosporella prunicola CBS 121167 TaxID=1176127 RepID=A0A6A6B9Q1_9PEZI|nr:uncharacterized protein K452DRAFT_309895 [Aplosporella prunicola CBS 121167]KAF2140800.1 hypothetical protein K452DRAFT_309895 [Aplosporella prunicola CBS 121167]
MYVFLLQSNPELRKNVAECVSFLKNGKEAPDPKTASVTREDALLIGQKLETSLRKHIEDGVQSVSNTEWIRRPTSAAWIKLLHVTASGLNVCGSEAEGGIKL